MATLTPKLTLTGTAADFGAALALSVTGTLTVGAPSKGITREDVAAGATLDIYVDSGSAGTVYVYAKNNNTTGSGYVDIKTTAGVSYGTLENGDFAFIPVDANEGIEVLGVTSAVELEYGYWTKTT